MNLKYSGWQRGRWFTFRGGRLKIRPWIGDIPIWKRPIVAADPQALEEELARLDMRRLFLVALMEWKNVWDADGKRLLLTEKVKEAIFDHELGGGLREFVLQKSVGLLREIFLELAQMVDAEINQLLRMLERKVRNGG